MTVSRWQGQDDRNIGTACYSKGRKQRKLPEGRRRHMRQMRTVVVAKIHEPEGKAQGRGLSAQRSRRLEGNKAITEC